MKTLIRERTPVARKDYHCGASEVLLQHGTEVLTFAEKREMVKARRQGYKILKGQRYINQCMSNDGELYTFKAIPSIHGLCLKHDLYWD